MGRTKGTSTLLVLAAGTLIWNCVDPGAIPQTAAQTYTHVKLTPDQLEEQDRKISKHEMRSTQLIFTDAKGESIPRIPWYKPVSFEGRFHAVGIFFRLREANDGTLERTHCTAFYVAPDVLATAAHCLWDSDGGKPTVTATSGHFLVFRQAYNSASDDASLHQRAITEWLYPKAYEGKPPKSISWSYETGFDWAFLRTDAPISGKNPRFYTLKDPLEYMGKHARFQIVGYPFEASEFFEPKYVAVSLHRTTEQAVKQDKGVQRELRRRPGASEYTASNQIAGLGEGNLFKGASGGPWFIAEDSLKSNLKLTDEQVEQAKCHVVGISAWATMPLGQPSPWKERDDCKATFTSLFVNGEIVKLGKAFADNTDKAKTLLDIATAAVPTVAMDANLKKLSDEIQASLKISQSTTSAAQPKKLLTTEFKKLV